MTRSRAAEPMRWSDTLSRQRQHGRASVELRQARGDGHAQVFLTGRARPGGSLRRAAGELFEETASELAERGVEVLKEKVYGRLDARAEILAARRSALAAAGLDETIPCSFIQGTPIERDDFAGAQIWGVIPRDPRIELATTESGRLWRGSDYSVLCVSGIDGLGAGSGEEIGVSGEARRMFLAAEAALAREGFGFHDVRRTWIYLRRILDWYGEFNRVRSAFFSERGIGDGHQRPFPASTGIQGTRAGEECTIDLLAAKGPGVRAKPVLASSRQGRAFDYGSAFSRAMELEIDGARLIFVSGTASIDGSGASLHRGLPQAQAAETLLAISALLEERGARLSDIAHATLFLKAPEALGAYREAGRLLGIAEIPMLPVVADVCRPELEIEIEAIAVLARQRTETSP